jgi:magnesium transporter
MRIEAIRIEGDQPEHLENLSPDNVVELVKTDEFTWIDIHTGNTTEEALFSLLVDKLDFHPATAADCSLTPGFHQPKMDEEQEYRFVTFLYFDIKPSGKLLSREIYTYAGPTYVITLHQHDCPDLLHRIRRFPRQITEYKQRAILFLHHVLDMVVDTFTGSLNDINSITDKLEIAILKIKRPKHTVRQILKRPKEQHSDMRGIMRLRRSLVRIRQSLIAEEEIIEDLIQRYDYEGAPEASEEIAIYYRDISDHIGSYLEIVESHESSLNHLMQVHSLLTTHRTNEIIFVLTIISTIMMPLNLIVGFFGMNFDNLWLIHSPWGIWFVTAGMWCIVLLMLWFFRRKGWV